VATLYIREHTKQARDANGLPTEVPSYPTNAEQTVAIGAASAASAAFQPSTTEVVLCSDAVCSIAVGANPTATASNWRLPANTPVTIGVPPNSGFKVAVITNT
jgi:hypothetical protein